MKKPTLLEIKLGNIVVHVEELLSVDGREADKETIKSALQDSEVRAFLDDPKMAVLLPVKRIPK